jgi:glycosyltransferase involved in cell wall biosynthesis
LPTEFAVFVYATLRQSAGQVTRPPVEVEVTVIIPTIGRESLGAAVDSALYQDGVETTVIVVADLPQATLASLSLQHRRRNRVRVIATGGGRGGGYARAVGTRAATTPWVAYLDDDDTFHRGKLRRQLDFAATIPEGTEAVISCQVSAQGRSGRDIVAPEVVYTSGHVATYLFERRRLSATRSLIHTSTLLLKTRLAQESNWNPDLRRHQDWDFVLAIVARPGGRLFQLAEPLVRIQFGSPESVSGLPDWRTSVAWAQDVGKSWPATAYADFLAGQALRYTLQSRDLRGTREVMRALRGHPRPSARALVLGGSGVLDRRWFSAMMRWSRQRGAESTADSAPAGGP